MPSRSHWALARFHSVQLLESTPRRLRPSSLEHTTWESLQADWVQASSGICTARSWTPSAHTSTPLLGLLTSSKLWRSLLCLDAQDWCAACESDTCLLRIPLSEHEVGLRLHPLLLHPPLGLLPFFSSPLVFVLLPRSLHQVHPLGFSHPP